MPALDLTPDLAHRLEFAEAQHLKGQMEACAKLRPELGSRVIAIAGGIAAITAGTPDRKLNHVTGFGLRASATDAELAALELAYATLGVATEIDLCPYADHDMLKLLAARGYAVNAFSNTYVKALDAAEADWPRNAEIRIERVNPDNAPEFIAASVAGFSSPTAKRSSALLQLLAEIALSRSDSCQYLARIDGKVAGTAGLGLIDSCGVAVAHLYIASTLPAYRGRGIQRILIEARLAEAKRAGFNLASITARPANSSARNALRAGFQLAYTKSTFASRLP